VIEGATTTFTRGHNGATKLALHDVWIELHEHTHRRKNLLTTLSKKARTRVEWNGACNVENGETTKPKSLKIVAMTSAG